MRLIAPESARYPAFGLTVLRVSTGSIFAVHGAQKIFVLGVDAVSTAFAQMGIPLAGLAGPVVAVLELVGGVALVAGFLTRWGALGLAANMVGALLFVHLRAGFFLPDGYEFVLALLGATAALAMTGPGAWSLDARLTMHQRDALREEDGSHDRRRRAA